MSFDGLLPLPSSSLFGAGVGERGGHCDITLINNLVDPASSHMLVSKIKPCMSQYKLQYGETANGALKQL